MVAAYSSCQLILICWSPKLWQESSLAPLALEIAAKALVASICEQLHIQGTGPVCIVEEANPIPTREVGEPPFNSSQNSALSFI